MDTFQTQTPSMTDLSSEIARKKAKTSEDYRRLVKTQMKNSLLRNLQKDGVGTPEVEETLRKLLYKSDEEFSKDYGTWWGSREKIVKIILKDKIRESETSLRKDRRRYWTSRNSLTGAINSNSEARRVVEEIRRKGELLREKIRKRHDRKRKHLG